MLLLACLLDCDDGLTIYQGHQEVLVAEIITASFDVLSNGVYRNESSRTMFLFRSFLVNKLPAFFAAMTAASMVPMRIEMCITQALSRLDPNAFPSFSQMFSMQGSSVLSDARQEFLFACASHRLIPESSIERLLGENPMQTLPVGGPYQKDDLVSQISSNFERADQLIGEIESMEGNAGAIVGAITEVCTNIRNSESIFWLTWTGHVQPVQSKGDHDIEKYLQLPFSAPANVGRHSPLPNHEAGLAAPLCPAGLLAMG